MFTFTNKKFEWKKYSRILFYKIRPWIRTHVLTMTQPRSQTNNITFLQTLIEHNLTRRLRRLQWRWRRQRSVGNCWEQLLSLRLWLWLVNDLHLNLWCHLGLPFCYLRWNHNHGSLGGTSRWSVFTPPWNGPFKLFGLNVQRGYLHCWSECCTPFRWPPGWTRCQPGPTS